MQSREFRPLTHCVNSDNRSYISACGPNCDSCNVPGYCNNGGCKKGYRFDTHTDQCMNSASVTRGSLIIAVTFIISKLLH